MYVKFSQLTSLSLHHGMQNTCTSFYLNYVAPEGGGGGGGGATVPIFFFLRDSLVFLFSHARGGEHEG